MNKRNYTSKFKRDEQAFQFLLTERDVEILRMVNRYRYLKIEQIKRLVFSENTSKQSAQKRLKYLFHAGYLGRKIPLIQAGHGSGITAYFVDKKGARFLHENGEDVFEYEKSGNVQIMFLQHALDLSEFRIHLEEALKTFPKILLQHWIFDFEVKSHMDRQAGMARFKLYKELVHPANRQTYKVYPDARFILKVAESEIQRLFFLEIDRGTESLNVIRDKVIGFNLYRQEKVFQDFGKFETFKVLFQTNSAKRAENVLKAITDLEGRDLVLVTDVSKVNESTVLKAPIWMDYQHQEKSILKNGG